MFEQRAAARSSADDAQRQLAAALPGIRGRHDLQRVGQMRVDQLFEMTGEPF